MSMTVTIDNTIVTVEMATTGPQGPTGATGATGPTGPQGPKGDTGAAGVVQTVSGTSPITATGTTNITVGINQGSITIAQSQVTNLTTDLAAKAPLASPTFTGDPKAPTPTSTDNDTSIATTAFVQAQKTSPALAGTPTAPTAALGTSTTQLATTEFVDEGTVDIRQFAADKSVLDNIPARIHPAEQLLKQAVFWIDANHSSASGQTITNLGWGGSALNATAGSTGSADSNDPKYLSWDGTNYAYLPGVSGNYLSVPDANDLDITGDLDVRFYIALDDWTPASQNAILGKWSGTGNQKSWGLDVKTNGRFEFYWSADGSANTGTVSSSVAPTVSDGQALWGRVTFDVDNGASGNDVKFWTSADGVNWSQLGSTVTTAGVTSIFASTAQFRVGGVVTSGETIALKAFRTQILNGINGTPVLDVDTSLVTSGSNTSFTALTGQTVTINRSTSGRKTVAVTHPCYLFGTDDYIEVNNRWIDGTTKNVYLPGVAGNYLSALDSAALDVTGDIDIRVKVALDSWRPAAIATFVSKYDAGGSRSYMMNLSTDGYINLYWSTDGTASTIKTSTAQVTNYAPGTTVWVRATLDVDNGASGHDVKFYTSDDGSTWTQLGSTVTTAGTTSIFSGASTVQIGTYGTGGTTSPAAGRFYRAVIYSDLTETTKVFDANMETSITSLTQTTFTESSTNAATVTINKSGTGYVSTPIVQSGYIYPTGVSNLTPSTSSLLDFGATDSFTVLTVARKWNNPSGVHHTFMAKKDSTAASVSGWLLYNGNNTATLTFGFSDGTTANNWTQSLASAGSLNVVAGVRNTTADTLQPYVNGVAGSYAIDTTTGGFATVKPLRIGDTVAEATFFDGEFIAAAIFRRVLTASEMTILSNYFAGRAA